MTAIPYCPTPISVSKSKKKRLVQSANNLSVEERAKILYREARDLICGEDVSDAFSHGSMFVCATALTTLEHNWGIAEGRTPDEIRQMFEWALADAGIVAEEISKLIREDAEGKRDKNDS